MDYEKRRKEIMDYEKRRKEIMDAMDANVTRQGELASEMRDLQSEFRKMELQQREDRLKLVARRNPPSGVHK